MGNYPSGKKGKNVVGPITPAIRYTCKDGLCGVDATGQYINLANCESNCTRWGCGDDGACRASRGGEYAKMSECQTTCTPATAYNCDGIGNCYLSRTGAYATQTECKTKCSDIHSHDVDTPTSCTEECVQKHPTATRADCEKSCTDPSNVYDNRKIINCVNNCVAKTGRPDLTTYSKCYAQCQPASYRMKKRRVRAAPLGRRIF